MIWCFWHIQHQNRIDISFEWPTIQEILSLFLFPFFACSKKWIDSKDDLYNELKKEKRKTKNTKQFLHILSFDEIPFERNKSKAAHYKQKRIRKKKYNKKKQLSVLCVIVYCCLCRWELIERSSRARLNVNETEMVSWLSASSHRIAPQRCRQYGASLWRNIQLSFLSRIF